MTIIFGKKRPHASLCAVCASAFGYKGRCFNRKWVKDHEILWVCEECAHTEIWQRVYSMRDSKLQDIENACIQLSCRTLINDIVKVVTEKTDPKEIERISERIMRSGAMDRIMKSYLNEFSIELKKWIS
jgi:hypothetical protein